MRQSRIGVFLTCAGLFFVGQAQGTGPEPVDLPREIQSAAGMLLTGTPPEQAAAEEALARLVRAAGVISREAGLPESSRTKIEAVCDRSLRESFLNEEASAALNEAYEPLNGGRGFVFPESVASITAARDYGRQQIAGALAALKAGDSADAARELLGFVLLVTTPMHTQH
jgi:hypothetical protein